MSLPRYSTKAEIVSPTEYLDDNKSYSVKTSISPTLSLSLSLSLSLCLNLSPERPSLVIFHVMAYVIPSLCLPSLTLLDPTAHWSQTLCRELATALPNYIISFPVYPQVYKKNCNFVSCMYLHSCQLHELWHLANI